MRPARDSGLPGVTGLVPGMVGEIAVSACRQRACARRPTEEAEITPVLLKTKDLRAVGRAPEAVSGAESGLFELTPGKASASTFEINGLRRVLSQS
jgi:hypothetical protein